MTNLLSERKASFSLNNGISGIILMIRSIIILKSFLDKNLNIIRTKPNNNIAACLLGTITKDNISLIESFGLLFSFSFTSIAYPPINYSYINI
ncbi:hypothetical protein [Gottschalkia purinilytica]|uniref:hypothetical protein n=1 Tax=Gottschalkia purinilytica TaxID=1503 RepID=UPI0010387D71|nr:hypothetical protein [Gottschalkia purinilytica]